jgi:hypothetical protein
MCAINPKRQRHFKLSVYTSLEMTQEEFDNLVRTKVVAAEMGMNQDMRLRWHVEEINIEE